MGRKGEEESGCAGRQGDQGRRGAQKSPHLLVSVSPGLPSGVSVPRFGGTAAGGGGFGGRNGCRPRLADRCPRAVDRCPRTAKLRPHSAGGHRCTAERCPRQAQRRPRRPELRPRRVQRGPRSEWGRRFPGEKPRFRPKSGPRRRKRGSWSKNQLHRGYRLEWHR